MLWGCKPLVYIVGLVLKMIPMMFINVKKPRRRFGSFLRIVMLYMLLALFIL
ncbi:hypothetical protein DF22_003330 [Xylella fastidiosa]|nr:hypothetical protein DF22_003330 [Xylella fastidiosa]